MFPLNEWLPCRDSKFEAKIFCTDAPGEYPIFGVYREKQNGEWKAAKWNLDGSFLKLREDDLDILPPKHTAWVNFYPSREGGEGVAYKTRKEADRNAGVVRIACKEVTYYSGEGLNVQDRP